VPGSIPAAEKLQAGTVEQFLWKDLLQSDVPCYLVTYGATCFAFFVFPRHSDGFIEAGTCCPLISDAIAKNCTLQGFLKM
jgi:hypothetical protein